MRARAGPTTHLKMRPAELSFVLKPWPNTSLKPRWWWSKRPRAGSYSPLTSKTMSDWSQTAASRERRSCASAKRGSWRRRAWARASSQWKVPAWVQRMWAVRCFLLAARSDMAKEARRGKRERGAKVRRRARAATAVRMDGVGCVHAVWSAWWLLSGACGCPARARWRESGVRADEVEESRGGEGGRGRQDAGLTRGWRAGAV